MGHKVDGLRGLEGLELGLELVDLEGVIGHDLLCVCVACPEEGLVARLDVDVGLALCVDEVEEDLLFAHDVAGVLVGSPRDVVLWERERGGVLVEEELDDAGLELADCLALAREGRVGENLRVGGVRPDWETSHGDGELGFLDFVLELGVLGVVGRGERDVGVRIFLDVGVHAWFCGQCGDALSIYHCLRLCVYKIFCVYKGICVYKMFCVYKPDFVYTTKLRGDINQCECGQVPKSRHVARSRV